jgi:ATP-binding cassette subfamily F protein 3
MLNITDISIRIAGRLLIDSSSAQIVPGARVGFVGRNGVGKSTLFHAIRGDLPLEAGRSRSRRAGGSAASRRKRPTARKA